MVIQRFIISPPFGNWLNRPYATSVRGSYTWERRRGLLYHTLRSLRPTRDGWRNQIGLRNPGIRRVPFYHDCIYSLVGLEIDDWDLILEVCPPFLSVEINLGCPNVHEYGISPETLRGYCQKFDGVIVKLPPTEQVDRWVEMCIEQGVEYLHLCNTLPTDIGGESGGALFRRTLPIVEHVATRYGDFVKIIAGGGIYGPEQLRQYRDAGASHFSLATVWLTPWRVAEIVR